MQQQNSVNTSDNPAPTPYMRIQNFLSPEEHASLIAFTLTHESEFAPSKITSLTEDANTNDMESRRSLSLYDLGDFTTLMTEHIKRALPEVIQRIQHPPFHAATMEIKITASNDGDYFRAHKDNAHNLTRTRTISFVYYFFREPKAFTGGELRIYMPQAEEDIQAGRRPSYRIITPFQNMIIFFPSSLIHEVLKVNCPSRAFADSRFTLNGHIHKAE